MHHRTGVDGRPPVQEIHDLALVRAKETTLSEIVVNARAQLDALPKIEKSSDSATAPAGVVMVGDEKKK